MSPLYADALRKDPRLKQAKELLLAAVRDQQSHITGIRPANPELKQSYEKMLEQMNQFRSMKLYYPYLGSGIGKGALVELLDGSIKYDFISGIGVHYLGHSHPALISASIDAAVTDTVMQGHLQQNGDTLCLTESLVKASGFDHCLLSTSGAMANENALKIAFQHNYPADRILAFSHGFAGRTLALSQITDKPQFRDGLPVTLKVDYLPFLSESDPEGSLKAAMDALKTHLIRYPKCHAALLFEPVQGEAGFYPGSHDFFKPILSLCREHKITIIADEVQSFGRTPTLFAFQYFALEHLVDIVTIGKLSQVCATLFRSSHKPKPGLISQTFTGSSASIHAGLAVLSHLQEGGYFGREGKIAKIHTHFSSKLHALSNRYPDLVQGPFGIGAMVAFTPLGGDGDRVTKLLHALFDAGVIAFIAGSYPARARFLVPAAAATLEDIDAVVEIIEKTLLSLR